jgi:hypothetical protein
MIFRENMNRSDEIEKYLYFVDMRVMICEYFLASRVNFGIRERNIVGRGITRMILGRVSHGGV